MSLAFYTIIGNNPALSMILSFVGLHGSSYSYRSLRKNRKPFKSLQHLEQESSVVARKPRDAAAVLFGLKFADNIHYKFKGSIASFESQASELQTCRRKTEFNAKWPFKVTCFGVSGKAIRD